MAELVYVDSTPTSFVPLREAAALLGVPVAWLKAEAAAGRVPYLRPGRQLLFNVASVEATLVKHAARERQGSAA